MNKNFGLILLLTVGVLVLTCIGFFMFTATLSSPTSMELFMPKDTDTDEQHFNTNENGSLTLLLGKDNMIYYYEGQLKEDASNFLTTDLKRIRPIIIEKKNALMAAHVHNEECKKIQEKARIGNPENGINPRPNWQDACRDKDFVIIIKPCEEATYANTVNILDEMAINDIKRYSMADLFPVEKDLIKMINSVNGR